MASDPMLDDTVHMLNLWSSTRYNTLAGCYGEHVYRWRLLQETPHGLESAKIYISYADNNLLEKISYPVKECECTVQTRVANAKKIWRCYEMVMGPQILYLHHLWSEEALDL